MTDTPKHPDDFADDVAWLRNTTQILTDLTGELHTLDQHQLVQIGIEAEKLEARAALLTGRIKSHRETRRRKEGSGYHVS